MQEVWRCITDEFVQKWQFPNCTGALDEKHIRIQCPNSGSQYSNYKKYFSLVLMAVCGASYKFTMIDIGQFGNIIDGVWAHSDMSHLLDNTLLDVPPKKELPGTLIATEYALVGDEAFLLKKYLLCPYPCFQLTDKEKVQLPIVTSTTVIENAFGILVSSWRILTRPLCCFPGNAEHLVKALICLHNFVIIGEREIAPARRRYCPPQLIDRETAEGVLLGGTWRGHEEQGDLVQNIGRLSSNNSDAAARAERNVLRDYFVTETGEVQVL
ncbi:nuclease harbi1-like protein [Lasius niger]|uniref:Nuclease harbi1-like protein n=1 Tax=Lasius niger TaxID=67767 RepID=A0A0J7KAZ2_LASNI|nr:nuclease harbi1-like protein [Lasius niger]